MPNHKYISRRLATAGTPELKNRIRHDWANAWRREQIRLINQLNDAINNCNWVAVHYVHKQLAAVTDKRFTGLHNVIDQL